MKIGIFSDLRSEASRKTEPQVISRLVAERIDMVRLTGFEGPTAEAILNAMTDDDMIISLGGDGTFLRASSLIANRQIPLLGINCGRLGFMADVEITEFDAILADILSRRYNIEQRSVLQLTTSDNQNETYYALNEIAVLKQDLSSMISITAIINGEILNTYNADGLLLSTPTGSTAYNLSVGGPLMSPQAQCFVIAPIASHSLTARPIVIPDNWETQLTIKSRSSSYMLSVDGNASTRSCDTTLTIRKAAFARAVVRLRNHTFFSTLKAKMFWGADKRE